MDANQRRSKSTLTKLHKHAGSLPPSARLVASEQHRCSANYNVQQNVWIIEIREKILWCVLPNVQQFIPGKTDRVWETKKQEKLTKTVQALKS